MSPNEKTAWLTLATCIACVCMFGVLFMLLRDDLGTTRAMHVGMSSFALIALSAFGPFLFNRTHRGDMVVSDDQGKVIRYPYRRFLWIAVGFAIVITLSILWLVFRGETAGSALNLLPFLVMTLFILLFIVLIVLHFRKQKLSTLNTNGMDGSDIVMFGPDIDERDLMIKRTARWSAFGGFWTVYVFGFIGYWGWLFYKGRESLTIDINVLPMFVFGGMLLIMFFDALVTVILYRQGSNL